MMRKKYFFKRSFTDTINILKAGSTAGCNVFKFNQLPNYTELTALFDEYKVNGVKYEFIPRFNSIDQSAAFGGEFYTALDRTDNNAPASLNELLEYQSLRKTPITRKHTRYFRPAIPTSIFRTVDDPALSAPPLTSVVKYSPWISTIQELGNADPTEVEHMGLKYWCNATGATANTTLDVICTAYFQMRTVK